jgi:hypothetical protein
MKKLYLFAALATMLAACSENDLTAEKQVVQQNAEEGAVEFSAYVNRGTTRAGKNGVIDNGTLRASDAGFGVFAYYTNGESYTGSTKPDFMYNQKVTYGATNWEYSPVKYWPNEFGDDAVSDQVDKLTLFAYAPYVEVTPLTGLVKAADPNNAINITGMTRNNATGDPFVKYVSSMLSNNSVDLCYGVAAEYFSSSNSAVNQNKIEAGKPYVDVVKPGTDANSKIKFDFKHALAQLNVTIDANVKDMTNNSTQIDLMHTRIWVRSVTFEGITQTGALNLNSNGSSPNWYDVNGTNRITSGSLTVYDGRKDGREANEVAASEAPATLNGSIVQSEKYGFDSSGNINNGAPGVTSTTINLFRYSTSASPAVDAPVFVIPTYEKMKVTIVYDVETVDKNLASYLSDGATQGSTIENRISKTIDAFGNIEAGKHYTLNLHLGMRTVDFDAIVTPWLEYGSNVDLPSNLQTFAAKSDGKGNVTLAPELDSYTFAVSGLAPNATPTVQTVTSIGTALVADPANGSGISIVKVTGITPNTEVENNSGTWVVGDGSNSVTLTVTQLAKALGLQATGIQNGSTHFHISLSKDATGTEWTNTTTAFLIDADHMKVTKNGGSLEVVSGTAAAGQAQFDATNGKFIIYGKANLGDVYTIWMQAGNAAPEKITVNVGGIIYNTKSVTMTKPTGDDPVVVNNPLTVYGPGTVNYEIEGTPTGLSLTGGVVSIAKTAAAGSHTVKATLTRDATNKSWFYLQGSDPIEDSYTLIVQE